MIDETDRRAERVASIDESLNRSEACHVVRREATEHPHAMLVVLRPNGVEHLDPIVQLPEGDPDFHCCGYTPVERFTTFGRHDSSLSR